MVKKIKNISKDNNRFTLDMRNFPRYFNDFKKHAKKFTLRQDGQSMIIDWEDKRWSFISYQGVTNKGFHLSKFVKEDVTNFLKNNPNYVNEQKEFSNYLELEVQKCNMIGLKKYEGQQIYCVDVNDCYWDTAYKLGFITKQTYLRGLKKKEWKVGRNACIGGLKKVITVTEYIDGVMSTSEIEQQSEDLSIIRDIIIDHVHESFLGILNKLNDDWLMYFTDCVYVPLERVEEVQDYFTQIGYFTKVTTYQLDKVDEESGMINWYDYQKNMAKGFAFAERQKTLKPYSFFDMVNTAAKPNVYNNKPTDLHPKLQNNTEFLREKKEK